MKKLNQLINTELSELANPDFLALVSETQSPVKSQQEQSAIYSHSCENSGNGVSVSSESGSSDNFNIALNNQIVFTLVDRQKKSVYYTFVQEIDRGAYGVILEYAQKSGNDNNNLPTKICLKVGLKTNRMDTDLEIIKCLPYDHQITGLIDCLPLTLPVELDSENRQADLNEVVLVMPVMTGNLADLFRKKSFSSLKKRFIFVNTVLYNISKTLYQLLEYDIYYTDLKLNNCLYDKRIDADTSLQIYLCDLGSAFLGSQREAMATFPQIYRKECHHFKPELFDLQYGLFVLWFQMMHRRDKRDKTSVNLSCSVELEHAPIKKLDLDQRKQQVNQIFTKVLELVEGSADQTLLTTYINNLRQILTVRSKNVESPKKKMAEIVTFFKMSHANLS